MYAFLAGKLVDAGPPTILDVGGIGFELLLPERDLLRLPAAGERVRLFTHFLVREDEHALYGFLALEERRVFRTLLSVNGVGPKVALAIVGDPLAEQILRSIALGDPGLLLKVKGVGKRTAERIVVELRDRELPLPDVQPAAPGAQAADDDATLALIGLGLTPERARSILASLSEAEREGLPVEQIVRNALRHARA